MISSSLVALALVLVPAWPTFPPEEAPLDAAGAARAFAGARAASDRDGGRLWGVRLYGPILLVDPATRRALANQADAEGRLAPEGGVFAGRLPDDVPLANTSIEWAGVRWATILWPLPDDESERTALVLHELFHRAQPAIGLPLASPSNAHLDALEGRYLIRLEWRALGAALAARGAARRDAVADALVFRARRRALFPEAAVEEDALELNEGLAEYTGRALAAPDPVARARQLLAAAETKPSYTRSFAYGSGPAYGLLLDAFGARWRVGLGEGADLGALLARAARTGLPRDLAREAERRAAHYGGDEVRAAEVARDRERREREARCRALFVAGPVLRIPLTRPNVSFDPNALEPVPGLGTVYPTMELADAWGRLTVTGGALLATDWSAVTVTAPGATAAPSGTVRGDGWTLELSPGWRVAPGPRAGDATLVRSP